MIRVSGLNLLPLLLATGLLAACAGDSATDRADLTLLFTGTVNGYVEPCGCVVGQIGGIDRIAGFIEDELSSNPDALFVETGDLVSETTRLEEAVLDQLPLKAEAFFSVWGELGCAAFALGENDLLTLGVEELQKLSARHAIPILCGNLKDADGEQVFESSLIVERAGKRIGIFSLLAPQLDEPLAHDAQPVDVAALLRQKGLRLGNWRRRAKEIIDELLPKTDLILCASHLGFDINRKLAKIFPQVDLVFGSHFGNSEKWRYMIDNTPVLVSLVRGSRVDKFEWWWPEPDQYFVAPKLRASKGNGRLLDASMKGEADVELEVAMAEYLAMGRREMAHDPEQFERLYSDKIALINAAERSQASMQEPPDVNRFSHVQTPMHTALRRSEMALKSIDHYHDELHDFWTSRTPPEKGHKSAVYAGPDACIACHPRQVDFWLATRHSFALKTLEVTDQEFDAECFYCHTVGYRMPGGFRRPGRQAGFENVQCAACHGPGAAHIAGGASYMDRELLSSSGSASCMACHNKEHDPKFPETVWRKFPMVACPQLEPVEERTTAMRTAAAAAAAAYSALAQPPWQKIVEANMKAGLDDAGMLAAQQWVIDRPKSRDAHLYMGELLLAAERLKESVRHFEFIVRKFPADVRAWDGLALALRFSKPERALMAAREAHSLEQESPQRVRTLVKVLIAQERRAAGEELLRGFLDRFPQYATMMQDLVYTGAAAPTQDDASESIPVDEVEAETASGS